MPLPFFFLNIRAISVLRLSEERKGTKQPRHDKNIFWKLSECIVWTWKFTGNKWLFPQAFIRIIWRSQGVFSEYLPWGAVLVGRAVASGMLESFSSQCFSFQEFKCHFQSHMKGSVRGLKGRSELETRWWIWVSSAKCHSPGHPFLGFAVATSTLFWILTEYSAQQRQTSLLKVLHEVFGRSPEQQPWLSVQIYLGDILQAEALEFTDGFLQSLLLPFPA